MKNLLIALFLIIPLTAFSDDVDVVQNDTSLIAKKSATLQILDKPSGKTKTITIPLNHTEKFDKLSITALACYQTPEYRAEEHTVFLQIKKRTGADSRDQQIFSGWMYKNVPGQNPIQDDTYDVWLINCQ